MMNSIRHVFFDLDHTLWDFDKNSALTFEKIFKIHNIEVEIDRFLKVYEPINLSYWKLYREERIDKENLRYKRLKDSFDSIEHTIEDEVINKLSVDYIEYLTSFNHLFHDTLDILNYLKPRYKLHIITNGFHEAQEKKMKASNILHYFETVTNSEMVGVKKPNPLIFNFALDQAKAKPNESIMIGDNYEADILGALDVGLEAILYNIHKLEPKANIKEVDTLLQLKNYL